MDHLSPEAKDFLDQGIVITQLKRKFGPHTLLMSYETIEIIFPLKTEFSHFLLAYINYSHNHSFILGFSFPLAF